MKNLIYILLLTMLCSCVRNERVPFEKAIEEVYGEKVGYNEGLHDDIKESKGTEEYTYRMDFKNFKEMLMAFNQLAEKVDSIMAHDYPSHNSYPGLYKLRNSWTTSNPITFCHWMDGNRFTVLMSLNTSIADNENYIYLSITKYNTEDNR